VIIMRKNYVAVCFAAVLPFCFGSVAQAQSTSTTPTTATQPGDSAYSLEGATLKAPAASVQQAAAGTYQLSGTSISGAVTSSRNILTSPVAATAAAYKTESGVYFYPEAFAGFGQNNNVNASATAPVSSGFTNLSTQVIAELKHDGDRYTALASVDAMRYTSSSEDNYTHSEINLAGDNFFTSSARAGWSIGQLNGSLPRFSNVRTTVDTFHNNNLNARLIYGAPEAPGRLELDLGKQDRVYDTNRATTALLDLNSSTVAGRGFYRVGTRTLALLEARSTKVDYASSLSQNSSSSEKRYYAGLTWEATAATTGIVKLGSMTKDFNTGVNASYSGTSWEAAVRWLPLSYSAFDFQSSKTVGESFGLASFELRTNNAVVWNHKWSEYVTTRAGLTALKTEYTSVGRTDTANISSITAEYALLRWLKVGVDFATTDSTSTDPNASYKRNITMLTLNASL
jgi:hypothetical protein